MPVGSPCYRVNMLVVLCFNRKTRSFEDSGLKFSSVWINLGLVMVRAAKRSYAGTIWGSTSIQKKNPF